MPSFLATVAGFMDWELAEVMLQGYPAAGAQGTNGRAQRTNGRTGTVRPRVPLAYCERVSAEDESTLAPAPPEPGQRQLRFAYVAGVTPGKWIRRWEERMPHVPLRSFMSDGGTQ